MIPCASPETLTSREARTPSQVRGELPVVRQGACASCSWPDGEALHVGQSREAIDLEAVEAEPAGAKRIDGAAIGMAAAVEPVPRALEAVLPSG